MKRFTQFLDSYLFYFLLALVLIMPLHAFLAISLGQLTGHQAAWQAWKEIGLVFAGIAAAGLIILKPKTRQLLTKQPAVWAAAAFTVMALAVSLVTHNVGVSTCLLGAKTTLSFMVLFIIIQTMKFTPERWSAIIKTLLTVSSAVGLFTVAQVYILPVDFLSRFGYGPNTVLPFHLVDPAVTSIRIIGTFSGPNQLASFMMIPFVISLWLITRKRWLAIIPFLLTGFAIFNSYSRSAWIGTIIAVFIVLLIRLRGWWKLLLLVPVVALAITASVLSGPVKAMTTDLTFYVFHGQFVDGHTNGSDSHRLDNAEAGLLKIQKQPLGYGLGTAGPASKNTPQSIITENNYLQIGIETGVIGLMLFGVTLILILIALCKRFGVVDEAVPLFATLIGLSATSMFLHTWADSATALVLWGLIGYVLAAPLRGKA